MTDALFDMEPVVTATTERGENLSAGQRLTLRQKTDIERGIHPLTRDRVNDDAARLCGNCRFRTITDGGSRRYLKCSYSDGARATHGAATDIRNWWPGCRDHEFAGSGT